MTTPLTDHLRESCRRAQALGAQTRRNRTRQAVIDALTDPRIGEGGRTMAWISSRADLTTGRTRRALRGLIADGTVTAAPDPLDRRVTRYRLTGGPT